MEKPQYVSVGIDISKANFDYYFKKTDGKQCKGKLENNEEGFHEFLSKIPVSEAWVVMEATGPYYYQLACFLFDQGIKVSVINPLVIKRFTQMQLKRTKTDSADAKYIAAFGEMVSLKPWKPMKECYLLIKQWYAYRKQLLKHLHAISMKMESFTATGIINKILITTMEMEISETEGKIKEADKHLKTLVEKESGQLKKQLESIPGIGPQTSLLLIVALRGFTDFKTYKQVISYVGLSPRIYESGTSLKGKGKICKMGMATVRKCLYMAATTAMSFNEPCQQLYKRLRSKGKAHKLAIIAVANKLLKQAFAIVKSGAFFDKNYIALKAAAK